jgi:hypothetical protein
MQKTISKMDNGEKKVHEMRERFVTEIISFNSDFNISKDKIESIFDSALKFSHKIKF